MHLIKSGIGALIAGVIGGAIWAAIAYYAHVEIGWIAWGVGVLVGIGAVVGAGDRAEFTTGLLAAVIALASVAGGKYAAVQMEVSKLIHEKGIDKVSEDDAKVFMARQLVEEYTKANKKLAWPKDMDEDSAEEAKDFPADLWKDTTTRWDGMDQKARDAYCQSVEEQRREAIAAFSNAVTQQGFQASFSPWDILWALLAIGSAYKIGSGSGSDD